MKAEACYSFAKTDSVEVVMRLNGVLKTDELWHTKWLSCVPDTILISTVSRA